MRRVRQMSLTYNVQQNTLACNSSTATGVCLSSTATGVPPPPPTKLLPYLRREQGRASVRLRRRRGCDRQRYAVHHTRSARQVAPLSFLSLCGAGEGGFRSLSESVCWRRQGGADSLFPVRGIGPSSLVSSDSCLRGSVPPSVPL